MCSNALRVYMQELFEIKKSQSVFPRVQLEFGGFLVLKVLKLIAYYGKLRH